MLAMRPRMMSRSILTLVVALVCLASPAFAGSRMTPGGPRIAAVAAKKQLKMSSAHTIGTTDRTFVVSGNMKLGSNEQSPVVVNVNKNGLGAGIAMGPKEIVHAIRATAAESSLPAGVRPVGPIKLNQWSRSGRSIRIAARGADGVARKFFFKPELGTDRHGTLRRVPGGR
jgi:hypothetical protein